MDRRQRELYAKQQQLLREQRSQDQEKLLACISGAQPPTMPHACTRIYIDSALTSISFCGTPEGFAVLATPASLGSSRLPTA